MLQVQFNTMEGMLSHVITRLSTSLLYERDEIDLPAVRNIPYFVLTFLHSSINQTS